MHGVSSPARRSNGSSPASTNKSLHPVFVRRDKGTIRRRLLSREPPSVLTAIIPAYPGGCGMSPYSCGMAAIPVRPENHGTRAAEAYGDGPCLLPPCLLPPYLLPPCLLPPCQLHLSAAISRLLSPGCCLQAAMLPGKCCLPALSVGRLVPARVLDVVHHDPARARRAGRNARIGRDRPLAARIEILRMQPVAFGDGACELFVEFL